MRITKTFKIEGYKKEFIVKELTMKEIISLMSEDILDDLTMETMQQKFSNILLPMCSNIEFADVEDMAPSELMEIWEKFKEANKSFFELAQKMGLGELMEKMKLAIFADFGKLVVPSSNQVTQES